MTGAELIRDLKGKMTLREMSALVGIAKSTLHDAMRGRKDPGREFIQKLVLAYPERDNEILRVFFGRSDSFSGLMSGETDPDTAMIAEEEE